MFISKKMEEPIGSLLGAALSGTFKVELERNFIPNLSKHMALCTRYFDDTVTTIKPDYTSNIINALNNFHENNVYP